MTRVAIVGAREHPQLELVRAYVASLSPGTVVISGGGPGVDTAAREAALEHGLMVTEVALYGDGQVITRGYAPARPYQLGREGPVCRRTLVSAAAGARELLLFRNTWIAVLCDRVVVFPDGSKGGAWDLARQAERFRRPIEVRWADGRVEPYPKRKSGKEG